MDILTDESPFMTSGNYLLKTVYFTLKPPKTSIESSNDCCYCFLGVRDTLLISFSLVLILFHQLDLKCNVVITVL